MKHLSPYSRLSILVAGFAFSFFACVVTKPSPVFADPVYPIAELGNCANLEICYSYCQLPQNERACTAYGNVQGHILGTQAESVTFPLAELGNCGSMLACRAYCNESNHWEACIAYGIQKELISPAPPLPQHILDAAKQTLGCPSQFSCMRLCERPDYFSRCQSFAQKFSLQSSSSLQTQEDVLVKAERILGCSSYLQCKEFCDNPNNKTACALFGESLRGTVLDKEALLSAGGKALGCTSFAGCREACYQAENRTTCETLARRFMY